MDDTVQTHVTDIIRSVAAANNPRRRNTTGRGSGSRAKGGKGNGRGRRRTADAASQAPASRSALIIHPPLVSPMIDDGPPVFPRRSAVLNSPSAVSRLPPNFHVSEANNDHLVSYSVQRQVQHKQSNDDFVRQAAVERAISTVGVQLYDITDGSLLDVEVKEGRRTYLTRQPHSSATPAAATRASTTDSHTKGLARMANRALPEASWLASVELLEWMYDACTDQARIDFMSVSAGEDRPARHLASVLAREYLAHQGEAIANMALARQLISPDKSELGPRLAAAVCFRNVVGARSTSNSSTPTATAPSPVRMTAVPKMDMGGVEQRSLTAKRTHHSMTASARPPKPQSVHKVPPSAPLAPPVLPVVHEPSKNYNLYQRAAHNSASTWLGGALIRLPEVANIGGDDIVTQDGIAGQSYHFRVVIDCVWTSRGQARSNLDVIAMHLLEIMKELAQSFQVVVEMDEGLTSPDKWIKAFSQALVQMDQGKNSDYTYALQMVQVRQQYIPPRSINRDGDVLLAARTPRRPPPIAFGLWLEATPRTTVVVVSSSSSSSSASSSSSSGTMNSTGVTSATNGPYQRNRGMDYVRDNQHWAAWSRTMQQLKSVLEQSKNALEQPRNAVIDDLIPASLMLSEEEEEKNDRKNLDQIRASSRIQRLESLIPSLMAKRTMDEAMVVFCSHLEQLGLPIKSVLPAQIAQ